MKAIELIRGVSLILLMPILMGHGMGKLPWDTSTPETYENSHKYNLMLVECTGSGVVSFKTALEEDVVTFEPVENTTGLTEITRTKALEIHEGDTFEVHIRSTEDAMVCSNIRLEDDRWADLTLAKRVFMEDSGTFFDAKYQLRLDDFDNSTFSKGDWKEYFILSAGKSETDPILIPGSLQVYHNSTLIYSADAGFSDPIIFDGVKEGDLLNIFVSNVNNVGTMDPIWLHKPDGTSYMLSYKLEFSAASESNTTYIIQ